MIRYRPYQKKKSNRLAIFLILLALFLSFSAVRGLFGVRSLLQAVIYPFQYVTLAVYNGVAGIPARFSSKQGLAEENAQLKSELSGLKPQLSVLEGLKNENARLRESLAFRQTNPYRFRLLAGEVIGKAPTPWYSILEINQGSRAGVRSGMPVISQDGLAGQVIEVSKFSSKVMLIIDAESSVAAAGSRSRDYGVVAGSPGGKLFMKYVGAEGDIQKGDKIVTSPISTTFPPDIPLGVVVEASKREHDLFYHVEIEPAVDFSKIEKVFVIL
ncbi:rod shape-determining protein MreC [Candidatus Margulisiibacteriota bacterium]